MQEKELSVFLIEASCSETIATAAKVCYAKQLDGFTRDTMSKEESDRMVNLLNSVGHNSPLEHSKYTFLVDGLSRSCVLQLVRHRIASYSNRSQRFIKGNNIEYVVPERVGKNYKALELLKDHIAFSENTYNLIWNEIFSDAIYEYDYDFANKMSSEIIQKAINSNAESINSADCLALLPSKIKEVNPLAYDKCSKIANENARSVLANYVNSPIVVSMNVRALSEASQERLCYKAQDEIRRLFEEMIKQAKTYNQAMGNSSDLFAQAVPKCKILGYCPEKDANCPRNHYKK